jgi:subtilisin family serine protease
MRKSFLILILIFFLLFSSTVQAKTVKVFLRSTQPFDFKELEKLGIVVEDKFEVSEDILVSIEEEKIDELKSLGFEIFEDEPVHILLSDSISLIKADKVWDYGYTGKGVKVCIVDTGIDYNHPALKGKVVAQIDFVNTDDDAFDDNGHGTHVAGIIASGDEKYRGVAPDVSLYIAKVIGNDGVGYTNWVINGLQWCVKQKVNVISMSLGSEVYYKTTCRDTLAGVVNRIVKYNNTPVVAAAGNSGDAGVSSPACASEAIAVGAIDKERNLASFSSVGSEVDLVAPGVDIVSTWLNGGYAIASGTSMATPHVAGVIALMIENNPDLEVRTIKSILYSSANKSINCGSYCAKKQRGNGLVDALTSFPLIKVEQEIGKTNMEVGGINSFTFKVRNVGYSDAYSVNLKLDSSENFKYYLPRQCQISSENKIECYLGDIRSGKTKRIKITVRVLEEGEYQSIATLKFFNSQGIEYPSLETEKVTIEVNTKN